MPARQGAILAPPALLIVGRFLTGEGVR